ncbi:hypothetical protein [Amycolatopsis thermophila]|uniref:Uncharacterized protein n=1 Tax=Amycolatopsis thermophila TaxID=206084 RepID=A0ABU0END2_9PSEU|nr:hypothetical protein [Amycolatopsis thermophila]MDQ0376553.1 hypothetical protein [Amycolatopsis thermophila]
MPHRWIDDTAPHELHAAVTHAGPVTVRRAYFADGTGAVSMQHHCTGHVRGVRTPTHRAARELAEQFADRVASRLPEPADAA